MNAFAPKHLGRGATPDNSIILKKTLFFAGDPAPGAPAHPGGGQLSSAGTAPTAAPDMPVSAPLDKPPRQSAALHFAPASYLALGREPQQAFFKPAIWDEPIKVQKRKKARKLYACGPSGNINPMF